MTAVDRSNAARNRRQRGCAVCGRAVLPRNDGQLRRHRIDATNPVSPYCPASGDPR